jgi:hypothetical protein
VNGLLGRFLTAMENSRKIISGLGEAFRISLFHQPAS